MEVRFRGSVIRMVRKYGTTRPYDIIADRRIVFAYRMAIGSKPLSVSLSTIEFLPCASGTLLAYTEQGAYFDDPGGPEGREEGTRGLLEKLAGELERSK